MTVAAPQERVRRFLAEGDGEVTVPFDNLLVTWGFQEPSTIEREQIVADLASAGVAANRPLTVVDRLDDVTLSLAPSRAPQNGHAEAAPPPQRRSWPAWSFAAAAIFLLAGVGLLVYTQLL